MVTVEENEERRSRRGHEEETIVGKYIVEELAATIETAKLLHGAGTTTAVAAVERVERHVRGSIVDAPVGMIGVEDGVDDEVREREEHRGETTWVRLWFFIGIALEEEIENETRVRKGRWWDSE
jgi:hypothetical protein